METQELRFEETDFAVIMITGEVTKRSSAPVSRVLSLFHFKRGKMEAFLFKYKI